MLPKEQHKSLKTAAGSVSEALWGMAEGVVDESPKKVAREAIAKRHVGDETLRFVETNRN